MKESTVENEDHDESNENYLPIDLLLFVINKKIYFTVISSLIYLYILKGRFKILFLLTRN